MNVTFEYTEEDYVNMFKPVFNQGGSKWTRHVSGAIWTLAMLGAIVYFELISHRSAGRFDWTDLLIWTVPLAAISGYWYLTLGNGSARMMARYLKRAGTTRLGIITIEITPDCVTQSSQQAQLRMEWRSFEQIVDGKDHIRMSGAPNAPAAACYIPERAFATPSQADLFLRTARAYWKGEAPPAEAPVNHDDDVWPPPPMM